MNAGTIGRGGVAGGAFSLSVVCDSWLDMAFGGRAGASASAVVVVSVEVEPAGGGGKSLTIWSWRQTQQWLPYQFAHLIQAIQDVLQRLGPFCSAVARVRCLLLRTMHRRRALTSPASRPRRRVAGWSLLHGVSKEEQELGRDWVPDVMPGSAWW